MTKYIDIDGDKDAGRYEPFKIKINLRPIKDNLKKSNIKPALSHKKVKK